jgi:hypothetical protein
MTLKSPRRLLLGGVTAGIFTVAAVAPVVAASRAAPAGKGVEAGRYAVLRDDKDTNCMVTLNPGGKAQLAPACRDNGIVVFDPMSWRGDAGKIILTARKGHKLELLHGDDNVWRRDGAAGKGLGLRPM